MTCQCMLTDSRQCANRATVTIRGYGRFCAECAKAIRAQAWPTKRRKKEPRNG